MKRLRKTTLALTLVLLLTLGLSAPTAAKDYLYVPCSNYLHIIDCETDTVVKTLSYNDYIIGCTASDDGKRLYINAWRSVYAVDTDKNRIVDRYDFWTELNRINVGPLMAVSPDGKNLYMIWNVTKKKMNVPRLNVLPNQFVIFDLEKREVVKSYEVPPNSNGVVTLKDDPDRVIIMAEDIIRLNINTGEQEKIKGFLHPEEGQPQLNSLALIANRSPGDHGLVCGPAYAGEERLKILDPGDSGLALGTVVNQAAYVETMQKVMMAGGRPPAGAPLMFYMIIDGKGDVRMLEIDHFAAIYSSVVSPDAKYLYAAMDELYKVDMKTGKLQGVVHLERGTVYSVSTTADGKKVYVGPAGPDLVVYDTETMKKIGVIPLKSDGVAMTRITK
jgi:WD40 repeat protein